MLVGRCFLLRSPGRRSALVEKINYIVVRLIQLRLRKVGKQTTVPPVAVNDQNFLAAIASHLVRSCLKQCQLQIAAVSDGTGLMTCLRDLPKIVLRENHSVLLLSGVQSSIPRIEQ